MHTPTRSSLQRHTGEEIIRPQNLTASVATISSQCSCFPIFEKFLSSFTATRRPPYCARYTSRMFPLPAKVVLPLSSSCVDFREPTGHISESCQTSAGLRQEGFGARNGAHVLLYEGLQNIEPKDLSLGCSDSGKRLRAIAHVIIRKYCDFVCHLTIVDLSKNKHIQINELF